MKKRLVVRQTPLCGSPREFRAFSAFDADLQRCYSQSTTRRASAAVETQREQRASITSWVRQSLSRISPRTLALADSLSPSRTARGDPWSLAMRSPQNAFLSALQRVEQQAERHFKKKKILILMSDTGGGHRASAEAIDQALALFFPGRFDVQILDIWTRHASWPFNRFVPSYRYVAKRPWLWRMCYLYGSFPVTRYVQEKATTVQCFNAFEKAIRASDPDMVISVHPLCHHIPVPIVREMSAQRVLAHRPPIPFVTIVTDLASAHVCWFDKRVDAYFVPSTQIAALAQRAGVAPERILQRGLPVRSVFWTRDAPFSKTALRERLGLSRSLRDKVVLMMGGGDGVGKLDRIASALSHSLETLPQRSQLVVICGHNRKTQENLQRTLNSTDKVDVQVRGFQSNIDEYMAASDCLISKAGPGTIAEAMIRGLPIVLSSYLPGQEYGNLDYCVKGGFGIYTGSNPNRIAAAVTDILRDEDKLHEMSRQAKLQSKPEATLQMAREIGEMMIRLQPLQNSSCE